MDTDIKGYVGVFDSGVGGISVLQQLVRCLPHENFYFFGDSANAPYGEKTAEEVTGLSRAIVERMVDAGVKAVVIACNTATSAAAQILRREYPDLIIVGVEPAVKPAVMAPQHDRVLVMATPMTVRREKFRDLVDRWESTSEIIPVPCAGLAARIEKGNLDAPDLGQMIENLIGSWSGAVDSVVLGCTHYPFVKRQIQAVIGEGIPLIDGGEGTARQLKRRLQEEGLLDMREAPGSIIFDSSCKTASEIKLYQHFFELKI
ncbi:MAG: glutamate racemase [Atopobiaceae bacterium]|jgi:glutamate racemase